MEKLKKRVLEYLAVRQLKSNLKGPILCFVGPPGVGKTSVGRSVAKTLGREFHRIALGGVCDQSDIRGHRYFPLDLPLIQWAIKKSSFWYSFCQFPYWLQNGIKYGADHTLQPTRSSQHGDQISTSVFP